MNAVLTQAISQEAFLQIQQLFHRASGILLPSSKMPLVASRLRCRLVLHQLPDFDAYCRLLHGRDGQEEARIVVDLLTTNETYFFREPVHFNHLAEQVLPTFGSREVKVWCAASSSGEEPYSIAMTLDKQLGADGRWSVLATDLSRRMLERARRGVYAMARLDNMPPDVLRNYCLRGTGQYQGMLRVAPGLRERVQFAEHNLTHRPEGMGPFDVIFMRNVLIYFDVKTKERIVSLALQALRPGGWLYVGRSETLYGMDLPLDNLQPSIYRKSGAA
ncbi:protein-glutamate O-methyltransferase CheR [Vogesella sp. LIG4]|uniref:CheR family methyltransferase n=1 Tax=Vogesella sp. LIG4 TaxID=1192162 RepID=UPI00081F8D91|nr:protein-glutamate O-methyltransferase CheR [Vogesella sp. LIG4]SCK29357.1 chemotaxis protein methyltransferase CheR [Vogesella sp. LIG4]